MIQLVDLIKEKKALIHDAKSYYMYMLDNAYNIVHNKFSSPLELNRVLTPQLLGELSSAQKS